jgi:hypothetical protein
LRSWRSASSTPAGRRRHPDGAAPGRVEWTTDLDNLDAQRFYTALGFSPYSSKVFYRVQGEELLRAAGDDIPAHAQDRS